MDYLKRDRDGYDSSVHLATLQYALIDFFLPCLWIQSDDNDSYAVQNYLYSL